jgi:hypothetical protein
MASKLTYEHGFEISFGPGNSPVCKVRYSRDALRRKTKLQKEARTLAAEHYKDGVEQFLLQLGRTKARGFSTRDLQAMLDVLTVE